jgi:hypothetical protein
MTRLLAAALGVLACALPAHAELVYFASGNTLSIKSHHIDGESLVLELRGGGEMAVTPPFRRTHATMP